VNLREIAGQWIDLMGHDEQPREKHGLVPPVEVNVATPMAIDLILTTPGKNRHTPLNV